MSPRRRFARAFLAGLYLAIASVVPAASLAQDLTFIRIGTGSTGGTYFPIGGLIASAISNPPGSRACADGGSCGVPGMIAVTQSTQGSVENVRAIAAGELDMALSQADVAFNAHFGIGVFMGDKNLSKVRAVANLYPEEVHIVVRGDSGIESVAGLKRKRVSLGEKASGTLVVARLVLSAYGLSERSVKAVYEKVGTSGDMLVGGELDAYFMVGGHPINAIIDAAEATAIKLLPISGEEARQIAIDHPFFAPTEIPAGAYKGVAETPTIGVGAQWVVSADLDVDLVYGATKALWHANNRRLLDGGHPNGRRIRLETALDGIAIPFHPGAERFYREAGLIPPK